MANKRTKVAKPKSAASAANRAAAAVPTADLAAVKLQKVYSEIDRIKSLADKNFGSAGVDENDNEEDEDEDEDEGEYNEDNLPDLAALSMEDVEKTGDCPKVCVYAADPSTIPDRCCPRPQSVSVSDYQHNKERSMSNITTDLFKRAILCETGARVLMIAFEDYFNRLATEDQRERCSKTWEFYHLSMNDEDFSSLPSVVQETIAESSVAELAKHLGLTQIPLQPQTDAGLDADLNIRRKLLLEFCNDKFHVSGYLEHSHVSTITECLNHPIPQRITKPVAQATVEHVIEFLTMCIEYKEISAIGDKFFCHKILGSPKEEPDDENAYLLWEQGAAPKAMRKVTLAGLKKADCLSEAQMEGVYQNSLKSARYNEMALQEFHIVCDQYTRWMKTRLTRETDLMSMAGERLAEIAQMLGHQGMLQAMQMIMDHQLQTNHVPDAYTFDNLSMICHSIDLEFVG